MSRMYDRMLHKGFMNPFMETDHLRSFNQRTNAILREAIPIAIGNVADYLYAVSDQENWDTQKDFPNVAPPFKTFWMEYLAPRTIRVKGRPDYRADGPGGYFGLLFDACDLTTDEIRVGDNKENIQFLERSIAENFKQFGPELIKAAQAKESTGKHPKLSQGALDVVAMMESLRIIRDGTSQDVIKQIVNSGGRWKMDVIAFFETGGIRYGPLGSWMIIINQDGSASSCSFHLPAMSASHLEYLRSIPDETVEINQVIFPALLALSFMHCKNVRIIDQSIPCKVNRARQKENRPLFVSYKTLEIGPMKRILANEGRTASIGIKQALHICRGHFADYRNGVGLFGKHNGIYWWDSHVRGSSKVGTVVKDYAVNPSNDRTL